VFRSFIKTFVVAIFSASLLAGCASSGGGSPSADDIVAQVQSYTKLACNFVPTASTIINILSAGNAAVASATAMAQAICAAMDTSKASPKFGARVVKGYTVTPGRVNGVPIH
jgi:hypothetical protein